MQNNDIETENNVGGNPNNESTPRLLERISSIFFVRVKKNTIFTVEVFH
jgi:hypothetical protein